MSESAFVLILIRPKKEFLTITEIFFWNFLALFSSRNGEDPPPFLHLGTEFLGNGLKTTVKVIIFGQPVLVDTL